MSADNAHVDSEVLYGTLNVIGRLSMTPEKRLEGELQRDAYRMRTRTYSDSQLQYVVGRVSPESDSRPISPRMVKPPPSLRRIVSGIYMTERTNAAARDDPTIEKMK
ncbi:hypothetical protein Taro_054242 [Colocasia esculenta]|uniref:Uncharacterized protein n=1 Tax=Colocasia esculenta TaxID=4460 RepID=A0A843XPG5_COLES|nr:hypothetical protein [Colocasia esculenta]